MLLLWCNHCILGIGRISCLNLRVFDTAAVTVADVQKRSVWRILGRWGGTEPCLGVRRSDAVQKEEQKTRSSLLGRYIFEL